GGADAVPHCDHGGANGAVGVESPLHAAALSPQGVNGPAHAANENLAVEERREGESIDVAFITKGPFELELLHLIDAQPGNIGRLEAGIIALWTPAVPDEFRFVVDRDFPIPAIGLSSQSRFGVLRTQVFCDCLPFLAAHR